MTEIPLKNQIEALANGKQVKIIFKKEMSNEIVGTVHRKQKDAATYLQVNGQKDLIKLVHTRIHKLQVN